MSPTTTLWLAVGGTLAALGALALWEGQGSRGSLGACAVARPKKLGRAPKDMSKAAWDAADDAYDLEVEE